MEEYICKFCGKPCKNLKSLRAHERLCKENPNRQESSFVKYNAERETVWNKGLTKETDARVKQMAETMSREIQAGIIHNYDHQKVWTDELRKRQSEQKKDYYKKHPDKHPNALVAGILGKMTYPEKLTAEYLSKHNIEAKHNWYFKTDKFTRYIDFYIEKYKLFIEVDGEYWHKDKEKDINKDKDALANGYITLRLKPKTVITQLEEYFKNISAQETH